MLESNSHNDFKFERTDLIHICFAFITPVLGVMRRVVTIRELGCNTEINDFKEWFGPLIHIDFYRVVYRKLRNRKNYVSV